MENGLTHFDKEGNAVMVDVSGKNVTGESSQSGYLGSFQPGWPFRTG